MVRQIEYVSGKRDLIRAFFILLPLIVYVVLLFLVPLPERLLKPSYGRIIRYRDGKVMRMYLSEDDKWRFYTPIDSVSEDFIKATLSYEDRYFYYHLGVNPFSILRAMWVDISHGKVIEGGSTLTMQLARILEPRRRTVFAKIIEAFRANQMELRLGKKRILEAYFNFAPYGGNVEGIKAASLFYLGKMPSQIDYKDASFLVSIPKSPTHRMPLPQNTERIKNAMRMVAHAMLKSHIITHRKYIEIVNKKPLFYVRRPVIEAPHAADFLRIKYPDSLDIKSSIDKSIQNRVEKIVASYKQYIRSHGARDISVVVIENSTRKVRALVGSFDYFDPNGGAILGFNSFRSPGSALKPFLYALSIQKGVITPKSLLLDAPLRFSEFTPEDFDKRYRGLVSAEDALSLSLNIPFVYLLKETGYKEFVELLDRAGLSEPMKGRYYGLPVITGGREVRLIDLTNLYVTLARGGMHSEYRLLEEGENYSEVKLLEPGAVYLTLNAISRRNRPDKPVLGNLIRSKYGPVFWKTGTSFGRRDALSIGFREHYTVGVWVGNFDGSGAMDIVGAILASPVMFDILKSIDGDYFSGKFRWTNKALSELTLVDVCAFSGYKPTENCKTHIKVLALLSQLPYRRCPYHRLYRIEKKTGFRACPGKIYKKGELKDSIFVVIPSPARKILGESFSAPEFPPDCNRLSKKKGLFIVSPQNGVNYFVARDVNFKQGISFLAFTDSKSPEISWFVDGKFYRKGRSGEPVKWSPVLGRHVVYAQDNDGRFKSVEINVKRSPTF